MQKKPGKVREIRQSKKVGTMGPNLTHIVRVDKIQQTTAVSLLYIQLYCTSFDLIQYTIFPPNIAPLLITGCQVVL